MFYQNLIKRNKIIAIVDGYSIGRFYAKKLRELGYSCVHIQSRKTIPVVFQQSFQPNDYIENIICDECNFSEILSRLKELNIACVIAGSEPGVELADLLSEKLGLISNGTHKSKARRDKYEMIEALKEHGLRTVKHLKTSNLSDALNFVDSIGDWPVVVKQVRSAGAENVFFCQSHQEIKNAFNKIIGAIDALEQLNNEILVESYLDGIHYVVNMVSVNGQHILSDLWDVTKLPLPDTNIVYDNQRILPCSYHRKEELVKYTRSVLDALEIKHGASHNEIIWTKSGPVLVESAARIMGAMNPHLISECIGRSQLELTLASYLQPEKFTESDLCDYTIKKHVMFKFLVAYNSGVIKNIKFIDTIKALPSFVEISLNFGVDNYLPRTTDLFTAPGMVVLCHSDEKIMLQDYAKICELEKSMFEVYEL